MEAKDPKHGCIQTAGSQTFFIMEAKDPKHGCIQTAGSQTFFIMEAKDPKHGCIQTAGSQTFFFNCDSIFTIPSTRGPTHKKTPVPRSFLINFC